MAIDQDLFETEQITEQDVVIMEKAEDGPRYGSKEWNDYVMSKFEPHELIDKNPICAGLRRVAEELLGDIISSRPSQVFPAEDNNGPGRATVVFEVIINWGNSGEHRIFADVADVWHGNTDDLFCAHPVATASTRAEGRALRKALKVRCLAAEELAKKDVASIVRESIKVEKATDGEWKENDSISSAQANFIDNKCKQLEINVMGFINMGENQYADITEVSKKTASTMLAVLNEYQNKQKKIPANIVGYDKNWR
tara:strand:- start:508 stop:1269 length:762 start_codon:yes stop_codon:yes gene_type:complete